MKYESDGLEMRVGGFSREKHISSNGSLDCHLHVRKTVRIQCAEVSVVEVANNSVTTTCNQRVAWLLQDWEVLDRTHGWPSGKPPSRAPHSFDGI